MLYASITYEVKFAPDPAAERAHYWLDENREAPCCLRLNHVCANPAAETAAFKSVGRHRVVDAAHNTNGILSYWSSEKPARRFCCQQASVDSVQKGFSLP